MESWLYFLIGIILTVGTGVFVASEFSMVALDRADLERRRAEGERGFDLVIKGLKKTSTHLSSAQLGITITTLLAGYTLEPALTQSFLVIFGPINITTEAARAISVTLAITVATLLSMIIGELIPKNYALSRPHNAAKLVMPLQLGFTLIMKPVVIALNGSANWLLTRIGIEPKEELSGARTASELSALVRHSANQGMLEQDTASLLDRALRFTERTAVDVMTPRPKIVTVHRLETAKDLIDTARKSGFSRFPVIDEDRDDIVGVSHLKQAIAVPREKRADVPIAALAEEAPRVPETMPLDHLLGTLRGTGFQMAIVVDEYGGTSGVVTLEDLVEELIGEVSDEHDRQFEGIKRSKSKISIPANLRPDEVLDQTGIKIPASTNYETVAGFVLSELGKIPSLGESVELPDGSVLTVLSMQGMRIDRLEYQPPKNEEEDKT